MNIIHTTDAPRTVKPEGDVSHYFLFDDYEIIQTDQPPLSEQAWHHHETIAETIYVVKGELVVVWREDGEEMTEVVGMGDVVEVGRMPHTFRNETERVARLVAIKRMPSGENYREVFKNDKVLD
jgi:uncharacterized cupin superfamily protein